MYKLFYELFDSFFPLFLEFRAGFEQVLRKYFHTFFHFVQIRAVLWVKFFETSVLFRPDLGEVFEPTLLFLCSKHTLEA
jgi:hypothetical protein